ncbi:MAG: DUF4468 domain-containing protein [Desulfuromusa sp.]|nr:DUF4468 domain-containing protein [Desulfuromusa sp.]
MLKIIPVFILLFLVTSCIGSLTKIPASEKTIHASNELSGQTQQQLMDATKSWIEKYFTAHEELVAFGGLQEGTITGNGQIDYPCSWPECMTKGDSKVTFTMRVDVQDGLISTRFLNIQIFSPASGTDSAYRSGMTTQVWSKRDMAAIRPKLLELNNKLVTFLLKN